MNVEDLVVEHVGWIRRLAWRYFDNKSDADDLASETIFKCLKNADKYDVEKSFKPWALTIMENTFKSFYNHRRCVLFTDYRECGAYGSEEYADQRAAIKRILSIIRKSCRKSISIECLLLYAKGYSYAEIAGITGVPVGTVRSRIATARRILHRDLDS